MRRSSVIVLVFLSLQLVLCTMVHNAYADDWGFFLSPGSWGVTYNSNDHDDHHHRYAPPPAYVAPMPPPPPPRPIVYPPAYPQPYSGGGYYPTYNPNPIVRRDVSAGGYYAPDGTWHSETKVEDRKASYYSPGRNEAITPPRTTVIQQQGPDGSWVSSEKTTWIGADGRPHSTTVDKVTSQDIWGNTHTDTHVTLKKKPAGSSTGQSGQSGSGQATPQASPQAAPAKGK